MVMSRTLYETRAAATDARATAQSRLPRSLLEALTLVYESPTARKPDLNNGVYGCARATAGEHVGFTAAWGYWVSAWIGNVGYLVVAMPTTAAWAVTSSGQRNAWAFAFPVASRPEKREQKAGS